MNYSMSSNGWDARWSFLAGSIDGVTTLEPQYTRIGMMALDLAPDGGKRYKAQWVAAVHAKPVAVLITSWNDSGDGTAIVGNTALETITRNQTAAYHKAIK